MKRNDVTARFCSVAEAAKVLGVSRMTLYRLIEDGDFPAVRLRSRIVVPVAALERLESHAVIGSRAVDVAEVAGLADEDVSEVMPRPRS